MGSASKAARAYLLAYNGALALSWAYVLYLTVLTVLTKGWTVTFEETQHVLAFAQSAAILEVFHAWFGLVRSPWFVTAVQVGSRLGVLWAAVWAIPEVRLQQWVLVRLPLSVPLAGQETPVVLALGVSSMFIAWSLSEIIRYSFYFCKESGYVPYVITWLRYTGFMVLYPSGVASELAVIGFAIPYVRSRKLYLVEMPNAWNFAMGITAWVRLIAFGYIFGFPMLYGHMLHQRKRALAVGKAKAE